MKLTIALSGKNHYNIGMEKRRSKRVKVDLKAERISGNEKYGVFIENISEFGIHILTTHSKIHHQYFPGADVDLKFLLSSGKTLDLHCQVRWAHSKIPPNGIADSIGLEIINPPPQYLDFVRALH